MTDMPHPACCGSNPTGHPWPLKSASVPPFSKVSWAKGGGGMVNRVIPSGTPLASVASNNVGLEPCRSPGHVHFPTVRSFPSQTGSNGFEYPHSPAPYPTTIQWVRFSTKLLTALDIRLQWKVSQRTPLWL